MDDTLERPSAKIYQFPVRDRVAANARNNVASVTDVRPPRVAGGAWYHDAAIQEIKPDHDL